MGINVSVEDAFNFLVQCLREGGYHHYGYDLYLPSVMSRYVRGVLRIPEHDEYGPLVTVSPSFYAAAWELCRRGILRPGIRRYHEQVTDEGSGGNGYSVTPSGQEWLQEAARYDYVPIEPGRFARVLDGFSARFGAGYQERAQEAVRCYGANAYVACCAMCGAAAESIILALAIAKTSDETRVLRTYESAGGRGRIEAIILGQQPPQVQTEFRSSANLLKYWRDSAAHGRRSNITDNEAYTSLALLLRFAQFANDRWGDLIANP